MQYSNCTLLDPNFQAFIYFLHLRLAMDGSLYSRGSWSLQVFICIRVLQFTRVMITSKRRFCSSLHLRFGRRLPAARCGLKPGGPVRPEACFSGLYNFEEDPAQPTNAHCIGLLNWPNKIWETGGLNSSYLFSYSYGDWNLSSRCPHGGGCHLGEATQGFLFGLQVAASFLCVFPWETQKALRSLPFIYFLLLLLQHRLNRGPSHWSTPLILLKFFCIKTGSH